MSQPKKDELNEPNPEVEFLKKFVHNLEFPNHNLKTRAGVQQFTEDVVNGIIMGVVKKDKAAPMSVMLPFLYKMAKEMEGQGGKTGGASITLRQTEQSITLEMSEEEMDAYLAGNNQVRVEVIEKMEAEGKIKLGKPEKNVVTIKSEIDPKKVKTDLDGIVQITKKTDIPLTKAQARSLFGRNLADKHHVSPVPGPDATGFSALFEDKRMKKIAPEGAVHQWKGAYEPGTDGYAKLWYTCQQCGKRQPNVDQDLCQGAQENREDIQSGS